MAKKIKAFVKLALKAGKATPQPPIGPALGQHGVNIGIFCKEYNTRTAGQEGTVIPVKVTVYEDRSFSFVLKSTPASILLLQYANVKKGSAQPHKASIGSVSREQVKEIALAKMADLNTKDLDKAMSIIHGTAKSMGIHAESV